MIITLLRIWKYLSLKRRRQFVGLTILILFSSITEVISLGSIVPFLTIITKPEVVIGYLQKNPHIPFQDSLLSTPDLILIITLAFGFSALFAGILRLSLLYSTIRISNSIGADLSTELYKKTLYQPYQVHIQRNTSEIISGITQKVNSASGMLVSLLTILSSIVIFLSLFFTLLFIDVWTTIASSVIFSLLYIVIARTSKKWVHANGSIISLEQTRIIRSLQEGLGGIRDVILDGSQELYCKTYQDSIYRLRKATSENTFMNQAPRFAMEAIGLLLIALLAYLGVRSRGDFTEIIPTLGAIGMGAQRLLPLLQTLYGNWNVFIALKPSLADVFTLLDQEIPKEYAIENDIKPLEMQISIRAEDLSFSYNNGDKYVLRNVNLEIPAGSRVGIIGETGSGKSTFMDILMGLVYPTTGRVYIDRRLLDSTSNLSWRKSIAHVPQNIFLTDSSIAENVAFGTSKELIDSDKVSLAVHKAQLGEFIKSLPLGLATQVGERGIRLSGGQKQRIGIARAIYKNAKVIFFDEATSALDDKTEKKVMHEIYNLSRDITIFMIAHRKNTINACDLILEVRNESVHMSRNFVSQQL